MKRIRIQRRRRPGQLDDIDQPEPFGDPDVKRAKRIARPRPRRRPAN